MPDYQHLKQAQCLGKQTAAAVLESLDRAVPDESEGWPFGDSHSNICRELIDYTKNVARLKQHVIALQIRLAPILLPALPETKEEREVGRAGSECADVLHRQVLLLESLVREVASLVDRLDL